MTIVGSAEVEIRADTKGFGPEAEKGISSGLKGALGTATKIIAAAGLGRLIAKTISSSIAEGREANKVAAQTAAVIASTGAAANVTAQEMANLASEISRKTGIDDEQIQASENLLATFTEVKNVVGEGNDIFNQATKTLVDMNVALGSDSAIQLGKALNDPIAGITALTRAGVTFNDTQKATIEAMVKAGNVAGAQKVILAELNKEFGGSAEAVATNTDRFKVAVGNIKEDIGVRLIPVIDRLAGWLADKLPAAEDATIKAFELIQGKVQIMHERLIPVVDKFRDLYDTISANQNVLGGLEAAVGGLAAGFVAMKAVSGISNIIDAVTVSVRALDVAMEANAAGLIVAAIVALGVAAVVAYHKFKPFHDLVDKIGRFFRDVLWPILQRVAHTVQTALATAFRFLAEDVLPKVEAVIRTVADVLTTVWGAAVDVLWPIIQKVTFAFEQFVAGVSLGWKIVRDTTLAIVDTVISKVGPAFATIVGGVMAAIGPVQRILSAFLGWFEAHVVPVIRAGIEFVVALFNVLAGVAANVFNAIQMAATVFMSIVSPIWDALETALGIVAGVLSNVLGPVFSAVFAIVKFEIETAWAVIKTVLDVLVAVWEAVWPHIADIIGIVFQTIWSVIVAVFNEIKGVIEGALLIIQGIFEFFTGILTGHWSKAWQGIQDIVSGVWDVITALISGAFDTVAAIVTGAVGILVSAFQGVWDAIKATVVTLVDDIVKFFTDLPGRIIALVSTLLDAGEKIGKAVIDGISKGISAVGGIVSDLASALGTALKAIANTIVIDPINSAIRTVFSQLDNVVPDFVWSVNASSAPQIPRLAAGAVVTNRPGGILANIAEGSRPEGVFPLFPGVLAGLAAIGRGGGGTTVDASIIVQGNVYGVDNLDRWADERDRKLAQLIAARGGI